MMARTAADRRLNEECDAKHSFHLLGVTYSPADNFDDEHRVRAGVWTLRDGREYHLLVYVELNLRDMLPLGTNLYSWGRAQMENDHSLLRALLQNVGVYYCADGRTLGRATMERLTIEKSGHIHWWDVPHALQAIDGVHTLTWHLLGPADYYRAAARAPVGCPLSLTHRVTGVTRTGVIQPDLDGSGPVAGYKCFWHALVSQLDEIWQRWPYAGLDSLPKIVVIILTRGG